MPPASTAYPDLGDADGPGGAAAAEPVPPDASATENTSRLVLTTLPSLFGCGALVARVACCLWHSGLAALSAPQNIARPGFGHVEITRFYPAEQLKIS